jgi:dihydrofolate synthase/folylpolyglutamate synthase
VLGLSAIRNILKKLYNPHKKYAILHIAGTNGKGSVAAALSSILQTAGYKVGLYTSPHLVRFNERICINGRQISDADVVASYRAVKFVYAGKREPTFFEYTTAMAFYEFGKKNVDWAVIETGMGGRLDATNIVKPVVSVITNISMEHRAYLGNTISQISAEKGGIIKNKVPVVTAVSQKAAVSILKSISSDKSAPFYRRGESFRVKRNPDGTFNYYGIKTIWRNMQTGLPGSHQIDNAALALAVCELIKEKKANLPLSSIREGLLNTRWPGRLEIVRKSPLVILDGAHNFIAARTLKRYLSERLASRKITMVIGILDDKPYKSMLKSLLPQCHRVIITQAKIDRALPTDALYGLSKRLVSNVNVIPNVAEAVKFAIETTPKKDAVCIAGSLYVVGEAKEWLDKNSAQT